MTRGKTELKSYAWALHNKPASSTPHVPDTFAQNAHTQWMMLILRNVLFLSMLTQHNVCGIMCVLLVSYILVSVRATIASHYNNNLS